MMKNNKNTYVYSHTRLDTNEIFYIGIAHNSDKKYKRAYQRARRSKFWNNIVNKTKYRVDILLDKLSWYNACLQEINLIACYGRKDLGLGTLVNFTDGGEGNYGLIHTKKNRKQISETLKSKNIKTNSKLTSNQVIYICDKLMKNYSYQRIKKKYLFLTRNMLCQIRKKRTWKEITTNYNFPKPTKEVSLEIRKRISRTLRGKYFQEKTKIMCLNDNKEFSSVYIASVYYKIPTYSIYRNINKETNNIFKNEEKFKFKKIK